MKKIFLITLCSIFVKISLGQTASLNYNTPGDDSFCVNNMAMFRMNGSVGDSIGSVGDSIIMIWRDGDEETILPIPSFSRVGHQYTSSGTYYIIAIAYLGASTDTDSLIVTILPRPNIDFSFTYIDICVTTTMQVQFTNLSDPGLSNYQWIFGDSGTSAQTNPLYTYFTPNNYLVSLTAEDANACSSTTLKTLNMPYDTGLVDNMGMNIGCPCNDITFSATGSADTWHWDFGDSDTSNIQNPNHTYAEPDDYIVTVTGKNSLSGCSYSRSMTITACPDDIKIFPTLSNNNWFFPMNNGLDFSGGDPVFVSGGQVNSTPAEGTATASDPRDGSLLFYTNGAIVWTKSHVIMDQGASLFAGTGKSSTEAALIIPMPGNIDQYYIFTSSGVSSGGLGYYYAIVDMTFNGGEGRVISKGNPLFTSCPSLGGNVPHEALKGTLKKQAEDCSNAEYWVMFPACPDLFNAYLITDGGISPAVVSSMADPTIPVDYNTATSASAIAPNGRRYAIIEGMPSSRRIRLMNFDKQTGQFSNQKILKPLIPSLYGITYSPDGTKLYAGGADMIMQYDLINNLTLTFFPVQGNVRTMSVGQNDKIYFVIDGVDSLGVINFPNEAGIACGLDEGNIYLNGNVLAAGLQNHVPLRLFIPDTLQANFTASFDPASCPSIDVVFANFSDTLPLPTPCTFYPDDTIQYFWDFGDGNTAIGYNQTHTYPSLGNYDVSLTVTRLRTCTADTFDLNINIQPDVMFTVNDVCVGDTSVFQATPLCIDSVDSYIWSGGIIDTGQIVKKVFTSDGAYIITLTATDTSGTPFVNIDTTIVNPLPTLSLNIISDTICLGESANVLVNSNADMYLWLPSTGLSSSIVLNPVFTPINNILYKIEVEESATGCKNSDSVMIVVKSVPSVDLGNDTNMCGNDLVLSPVSDGFNYLWSTGSVESNITIVQAGEYWVQISNSFCVATDSIKVSSCNKFFIPNGFTPNNDGSNDIFNLKGLGIQDYVLRIYNRWGNILFETGNMNFGWDGKHNNLDAESGVYVYNIEINFFDKSQIKEKGNFTLIR